MSKTKFEKFSRCIRTVMKFKFVLDVLTIVIIVLTELAFFIPTHVDLSEALVGYWLWLLANFFLVMYQEFLLRIN